MKRLTKDQIDNLVWDLTIGSGYCGQPHARHWQRLADLLEIGNVPDREYDLFERSWQYHLQMMCQP